MCGIHFFGGVNSQQKSKEQERTNEKQKKANQN